MRLSSLFLFLMLFTVAQGATPVVTTHDALAVVRVDGLDDTRLAALSKHLGGERTIALEYACTWAGVVVLKFNDTSASERADVVTLVDRHLREAGLMGRIEVLHVHLRPTGSGKC